MKPIQWLITVLANIAALFVLWALGGCVLTFVISAIYVNSANYCRDCDTGIGLMCIGFALSVLITPIIALIVLYFMSSEENDQAERKSKRKPKNEELTTFDN